MKVKISEEWADIFCIKIHSMGQAQGEGTDFWNVACVIQQREFNKTFKPLVKMTIIAVLLDIHEVLATFLACTISLLFYFFTVKYGKILHFDVAASCLVAFWLPFFFAGVTFLAFVWLFFAALPLLFPFRWMAPVFDSSASASCFILASVFNLFFCCKRHHYRITPQLPMTDCSGRMTSTITNISNSNSSHSLGPPLGVGFLTSCQSCRWFCSIISLN